jgi:hypothetical protein
MRQTVPPLDILSGQGPLLRQSGGMFADGVTFARGSTSAIPREADRYASSSIFTAGGPQDRYFA